MKEVSRGFPGKRLKGTVVVREHMGWVRKHREDCGHENRGGVIGQDGLCFE